MSSDLTSANLAALNEQMRGLMVAQQQQQALTMQALMMKNFGGGSVMSFGGGSKAGKPSNNQKGGITTSVEVSPTAVKTIKEKFVTPRTMIDEATRIMFSPDSKKKDINYARKLQTVATAMIKAVVPE